MKFVRGYNCFSLTAGRLWIHLVPYLRLTCRLNYLGKIFDAQMGLVRIILWKTRGVKNEP